MTRQPYSVRNDIACRNVLAGEGVVELEGGQEITQRPVPIKLAFIDQQTQIEGRKGFGARADGKQAVGCDRLPALTVAQPKALAQQDFFPAHYPHPYAGHFP